MPRNAKISVGSTVLSSATGTPHNHRIRVSKSMREDIKVWLTFLSEYNGVTVITNNAWASNETLELFTDSAGGQNRGFGIYFQGKWAQKC
jgi:hypothetical protein